MRTQQQQLRTDNEHIHQLHQTAAVQHTYMCDYMQKHQLNSTVACAMACDVRPIRRHTLCAAETRASPTLARTSYFVSAHARAFAYMLGRRACCRCVCHIGAFARSLMMRPRAWLRAKHRASLRVVYDMWCSRQQAAATPLGRRGCVVHDVDQCLKSIWLLFYFCCGWLWYGVGFVSLWCGVGHSK